MKKLGFGRNDDANRKTLFGLRNKSKSPATLTNNPYANQSTSADEYNKAKAKAGVPGFGQYDMNGGHPEEKKFGGYGGRSSPGYQNVDVYGADRYDAQSGYGDDRYGTGVSQRDIGGSNCVPGVYQGLGPTPSATNIDADKDALFGGARERVQQKDNQEMGNENPPPYDQGQAKGYGDNSGPSSQAYGDKCLTAEEEEEEDVEATKQQIRSTKQEDVSLLRNALRAANQAMETGADTLARMGAQGEQIHSTNMNLDMLGSHNHIAEDKTKQLKTLNGSMFNSLKPRNPFDSSEKQDAKFLEIHQRERDQREATRKEGFKTNQRLQKAFNDMSKDGAKNNSQNQKSLADRAKYQFEPDSDDDEMENGAASRHLKYGQLLTGGF